MDSFVADAIPSSVYLRFPPGRLGLELQAAKQINVGVDSVQSVGIRVRGWKKDASHLMKDTLEPFKVVGKCILSIDGQDIENIEFHQAVDLLRKSSSRTVHLSDFIITADENVSDIESISSVSSSDTTDGNISMHSRGKYSILHSSLLPKSVVEPTVKLPLCTNKEVDISTESVFAPITNVFSPLRVTCALIANSPISQHTSDNSDDTQSGIVETPRTTISRLMHERRKQDGTALMMKGQIDRQRQLLLGAQDLAQQASCKLQLKEVEVNTLKEQVSQLKHHIKGSDGQITLLKFQLVKTKAVLESQEREREISCVAVQETVSDTIQVEDDETPVEDIKGIFDRQAWLMHYQKSKTFRKALSQRGSVVLASESDGDGMGSSLSAERTKAGSPCDLSDVGMQDVTKMTIKSGAFDAASSDGSTATSKEFPGANISRDHLLSVLLQQEKLNQLLVLQFNTWIASQNELTTAFDRAGISFTELQKISSVVPIHQKILETLVSGSDAPALVRSHGSPKKVSYELSNYTETAASAVSDNLIRSNRVKTTSSSSHALLASSSAAVAAATSANATTANGAILEPEVACQVSPLTSDTDGGESDSTASPNTPRPQVPPSPPSSLDRTWEQVKYDHFSSPVRGSSAPGKQIGERYVESPTHHHLIESSSVSCTNQSSAGRIRSSNNERNHSMKEVEAEGEGKPCSEKDGKAERYRAATSSCRASGSDSGGDSNAQSSRSGNSKTSNSMQSLMRSLLTTMPAKTSPPRDDQLHSHNASIPSPSAAGARTIALSTVRDCDLVSVEADAVKAAPTAEQQLVYEDEGVSTVEDSRVTVTRNLFAGIASPVHVESKKMSMQAASSSRVPSNDRRATADCREDESRFCAHSSGREREQVVSSQGNSSLQQSSPGADDRMTEGGNDRDAYRKRSSRSGSDRRSSSSNHAHRRHHSNAHRDAEAAEAVERGRAVRPEAVQEQNGHSEGGPLKSYSLDSLRRRKSQSKSKSKSSNVALGDVITSSDEKQLHQHTIRPREGGRSRSRQHHHRAHQMNEGDTERRQDAQNATKTVYPDLAPQSSASHGSISDNRHYSSKNQVDNRSPVSNSASSRVVPTYVSEPSDNDENSSTANRSPREFNSAQFDHSTKSRSSSSSSSALPFAEPQQCQYPTSKTAHTHTYAHTGAPTSATGPQLRHSSQHQTHVQTQAQLPAQPYPVQGRAPVSVTVLSPNSFRLQMSKLHQENCLIRDDIDRFRGNLKKLREECSISSTPSSAMALTYPQSTYSHGTHPQSTYPQSTYPQAGYPHSTYPYSTVPLRKPLQDASFIISNGAATAVGPRSALSDVKGFIGSRHVPVAAHGISVRL